MKAHPVRKYKTRVISHTVTITDLYYIISGENDLKLVRDLISLFNPLIEDRGHFQLTFRSYNRKTNKNQSAPCTSIHARSVPPK